MGRFLRTHEDAYDAERDMAEDAMRDEDTRCGVCKGLGFIKEYHGMEGGFYESLPCDACDGADESDEDEEEEDD